MWSGSQETGMEKRGKKWSPSVSSAGEPGLGVGLLSAKERGVLLVPDWLEAGTSHSYSTITRARL